MPLCDIDSASTRLRITEATKTEAAFIILLGAKLRDLLFRRVFSDLILDWFPAVARAADMMLATNLISKG